MRDLGGRGHRCQQQIPEDQEGERAIREIPGWICRGLEVSFTELGNRRIGCRKLSLGGVEFEVWIRGLS